jgi:uncharacterized protein YbjT (DUF2867 family)
MPDGRTILVTGATGRQGGAVIRALMGKGFHLRAMTRKPDGDSARALAAQGVDVMRGDYDEPASLKGPLAGVWGALSIQNTWEAGVQREEEQGKRFATMAREAGVQHFVYTSVGSAHKQTGIPHFENKFRVEQKVKELAFPSHVILRPVFFMENLLAPWTLQGDKLVMALEPRTRVQMIASDDIGKFAALAFAEAGRRRGAEVDLAGDEVTLPEAARAIGDAQGRAITYQPMPIAAVRQNSADMAIMMEWFDRVGYSADIAALERDWGVHPRKLVEWLKTAAPK